MKEMIQSAIDFATHAHEGQVDKAGAPYIEHPLAVMEALKRLGHTEQVQVAGVLHDVVEDTDYTVADIVEMFGQGVGALVAAVTKTQQQPYHYYLSQVAYGGPDAEAIKLVDIEHNLGRIDALRAAKPYMGRWCSEATFRYGSARLFFERLSRPQGERMLDWIGGVHVGISSATIFSVLSGYDRRLVMQRWRPSVPLDAGDFWRCARLLQEVPEFRVGLHRVAEAYPEWEDLVDRFDEIAALVMDGTHRWPAAYEMIKAAIGRG